MPTISAERINALAKLNNARSYLEIGVARGETFKDVSIPLKTGVDPHFWFDWHVYNSAENVFLFEMTSDDYFRKLPELARDVYQRTVQFDLVFIDGQHTYEQALRDFDASQPWSHARTIWIFDDTVPSDPWSCLPDMEKSLFYRKMAGVASNPWHGDVFKVIFALHDFYPEFSWATVIDHGNPQTVVWKTQAPAPRAGQYGGKERIAQLGYFNLLDSCTCLNPVQEKDLESWIGRPFVEAAQTTKDEKLDILAKLVPPVAIPQAPSPPPSTHAPCLLSRLFRTGKS